MEAERVDPAGTHECKTSVTLTTLRSEYEKHFPKALDTIGHKVIDHLLIHFVSVIVPTNYLA